MILNDLLKYMYIYVTKCITNIKKLKINIFKLYINTHVVQNN